MQLETLDAAHHAPYYSLGRPGPAIRHVWFCLHGHEQPVAELAAQLVHLDTPERLLILPQAPVTGLSAEQSVWFTPASLGPNLAFTRTFLDQLADHILTACPPDTPYTVLGYGHGATAASVWLASNRFRYERLIFYAAVFPSGIRRAQLFAALPHHPIVVAATTADTFTPEAEGQGLVLDLRAAGQSAQLRYVDDGPLTLAALGAGGDGSGAR
ncbi:hypothetical protein [uncultured Hymenobacter sp.]|uniref:hypothetical protein n=1 Tax=uncultured Hymenobacter sp. TaxID=170016 RepID=UPI0035CA524D